MTFSPASSCPKIKVMPDKDRKYQPREKTGEDIDMLNERRQDEDSSYSSHSDSYKDDIDGA